MKVLKLYNKNLLALRSHQWKYHLDAYSGCEFGCSYCIRRKPGGSDRVHPVPDFLESLKEDLDLLQKKQIIFIGLLSDPYQPVEKDMRLTRQALQAILAQDLPVVVLTKSPLVLRDLDLLQDLHRHGNLLVQFTVLTRDDDRAGVLEPFAPSPSLRLSAADHLSRRGIPVHFHLAPYIPGFHTPDDLRQTIQAMSDHGGRCIYTNPLGIPASRRPEIAGALGRLERGSAEVFLSFYPATLARSAVLLPEYKRLFPAMSDLKEMCEAAGLTFVCEFIPALTSLGKEKFQEGVFRRGLPAVYQMLSFWNERGVETIDWATFRQDFLSRHEAIDPEYESLINAFWRTGELFENTLLTRQEREGEVVYAPGKQLDVRGPRLDRPLRASLLRILGALVDNFRRNPPRTEGETRVARE